MMDHVINESEKAYAGTSMADTFMIFHDGLSLWWAPKGQAFMESRGFAHRQLRILGKSRVDKVSRHYKMGKLVGDSPELCRALDSNGFVVLDAAVAFQCELASTDTSAAGAALRAKWDMGRIGALWACMEKTWMELAPSRKRVTEDADRMLVVLDKIIAAGGCVVTDEFLRTGRRAARADDTKALGGRFRKHQRTKTLEARLHHPDFESAYALLVDTEHAQSHTSH
jgi:hypothetical protein